MQKQLRFDDLPEAAEAAASHFYRHHLPTIEAALGPGISALVLVLPGAAYDHAGWRRAAVQQLARAHRPVRINCVAGDDAGRIDRMIAWLADAPGVTGQLLETA